MDIASAKAVITGGASGLGFATAERIIAEGGQVVLMDVNEEQGEVRAAELGDRALFLHTDVSDESNVKTSIQSANEFMSGITLAVTRRSMAKRQFQSRYTDQPGRQLQRHERGCSRNATE